MSCRRPPKAESSPPEALCSSRSSSFRQPANRAVFAKNETRLEHRFPCSTRRHWSGARVNRSHYSWSGNGIWIRGEDVHHVTEIAKGLDSHLAVWHRVRLFGEAGH